MFGKHFQSMYRGSMYGAGLNVFAVWGYVVAHAYKYKVELNPLELSHTLGGTVGEIERAIDYLTKPDPHSRNKEFEGRRLVKEGEFQYHVPSWDHYQKIRDESARMEYNRMAKRRERDKKVGKPYKDRETKNYEEGL